MRGEKTPEMISSPKVTTARPKVREKKGLSPNWYAHPFAGLPPAARPFRPSCEAISSTERLPSLSLGVRPHPLARMRSSKGRAAGAIAPLPGKSGRAAGSANRSGQTGAR
jgi:hypothetical protein